jgi:hypothetical protein
MYTISPTDVHILHIATAYGTLTMRNTEMEGGEPMRTQDGVQSLVRLSVNLSPAVFGDLKEYADRKGVSVTEAVRRAISVLKYVDDAQDRGASLNIEENGNLKEVQFMV